MAFEASPIFIGGIYRSGTSLLRAMLSQHSNIVGGLETFWFDMDFAGANTTGETIRNWDGTRSEPLEGHLSRLAEYFEFDREALVATARECSGAEEFLDRFMGEYARNNGKARWAEKTPPNVLHVGRIFTAWPEACFIHVIRDPRDVYSSLRSTSKYVEPADFARLWLKFMAAHENARRSMPDARMMEVRYEDLVLEPEATMRSVVGFVGEPWEDAVGRFEGQKEDYDKVKAVSGHSSTTLERLCKPLFKDRIGAWKREIGDDVAVEAIERIVRDAGFGKVWEKCIFAPGEAG